MDTDINTFFNDVDWPKNLTSLITEYHVSNDSNRLNVLLLGNELSLEIQEKVFTFICNTRTEELGDLPWVFFEKANVTPELLDRIAKQVDPAIARLVATNPNTSSATLKYILTEGFLEQTTVADILDHPNCTSEIAMLIASNEDYWGEFEALDALSTCRALNDNDVMKLLDDWKNDVQEYYGLDLDNLIKNPNISEETRDIIKNFELE
jgi:hypothetical protein